MILMQKKMLIGGAIILVAVGLIVWAAVRAPRKPANTGSTPSAHVSPTPDPSKLPPAVFALVKQYLQAREGAIGADQASPTSWLATVQPLTTPGFFAELQPNPNSSTGTVSADYYTAHSNGYVVQARPTNCFWDLEASAPTPTSGTVYCNYTDVTVSQSTGVAVPNSSLPFGWSSVGSQPAATFKVVKQNGVWLISDDTSADEG